MPEIDLKGETEESLVEAIRKRKQKALSCLYDAYAPILLGVISRIVHDSLVAEEVLKDTFTAIWSRISVYDSTKSRFLTWSLALARGIALEAVKTGKYQALADSQLNTTFVSEEEEELKKALQSVFKFWIGIKKSESARKLEVTKLKSLWNPNTGN